MVSLLSRDKGLDRFCREFVIFVVPVIFLISGTGCAARRFVYFIEFRCPENDIAFGAFWHPDSFTEWTRTLSMMVVMVTVVRILQIGLPPLGEIEGDQRDNQCQ